MVANVYNVPEYRQIYSPSDFFITTPKNRWLCIKQQGKTRKKNKLERGRAISVRLSAARTRTVEASERCMPTLASCAYARKIPLNLSLKWPKLSATYTNAKWAGIKDESPLGMEATSPFFEFFHPDTQSLDMDVIHVHSTMTLRSISPGDPAHAIIVVEA